MMRLRKWRDAPGRGVVLDVWKLETIGRTPNRRMPGAALLVLGFIYNKYQEKSGNGCEPQSSSRHR